MAKIKFPFTLGVASGEPAPDGVIIWTRLAPDPLNGGGMPASTFDVRWEVAEDDTFAKLTASGTARAQPSGAHSVHVKVTGLRPASVYFYRFRADGHTSRVGRTKTAPAPASTAPLRIAVASCQRYEHGHFTAYRHLVADEPDVILHLGDYIYEYGKPAVPEPGRYVRPLKDSTAACTTLNAYRERYALYRLDPDLQAAHAAAPWITIPDDHEVVNNYGGRTGDPKRRKAAYQANAEHLPYRVKPSGDTMQYYRWRPFGKVLDLLVADARQYRVAGDILGPAQTTWLLDRLKASTARWTVLAQALFFAPRNPPSTDAWDAYPQSRRKVLDAAPENFVVLSGDVHNAWAARLDRGVEFVATAISSAPPAVRDDVLERNPHLAFFDGRRGYLVANVSMEEFTADYRAVAYVDRPGAPVSTAASFRAVGNKLERIDL
ncbi:alkaline phosphatase [Herbidospora sp. NEAU-GS84]|uniref:Alkaline phosphatase n=1 Tax=Herbidospora solisilvae TaxID=2696284 RepID=A0A7C9NF47_9ACTN|nr:alkaline phosphatase D family protein [Herbidospora solisilvae]NAS23295.1 alkaline phosphatase [Herbidospora solisilvae]